MIRSSLGGDKLAADVVVKGVIEMTPGRGEGASPGDGRG
jgi:hypothetical protein